jgi:hypothetical protein
MVKNLERAGKHCEDEVSQNSINVGVATLEFKRVRVLAV